MPMVDPIQPTLDPILKLGPISMMDPISMLEPLPRVEPLPLEAISNRH